MAWSEIINMFYRLIWDLNIWYDHFNKVKKILNFDMFDQKLKDKN
jgi:hypothetical protein